MIGFGAIVKGIAGALDRAAAATERGVRDAISAARGPKPCPIYVKVEPARRRR